MSLHPCVSNTHEIAAVCSNKSLVFKLFKLGILFYIHVLGWFPLLSKCTLTWLSICCCQRILCYLNSSHKMTMQINGMAKFRLGTIGLDYFVMATMVKIHF